MISEEEEEEIDTIEEDEKPFDSSEEYFAEACNSGTGDKSAVQNRLTFDGDNSKRQCTEVKDEYDAIGVNVAAKLRNLPANMRILSEKLINDVLFQAQTNSLSSSTIIMTPDPFKLANET